MSKYVPRFPHEFIERDPSDDPLGHAVFIAQGAYRGTLMNRDEFEAKVHEIKQRGADGILGPKGVQAELARHGSSPSHWRAALSARRWAGPAARLLGANQMHYEDAIKFLAERLRRQPDAFPGPGGSDPEFDVYIPKAVTTFLAEATGNDRLHNVELCRAEDYRPTWIAFYDAASELCRRGILRPGRSRPMGNGSAVYELEERYSFTGAGREWLASTTLRYIPTAPGRYLAALKTPGKLLGPGFMQRAGEAAGCHLYENHLACCAMCGAAAESALLAIADAKTGDADRVRREYKKSGSRQNVTKLIFGSSTTRLSNEFQSAFDLLSYWRDEAAHGGPSTISPAQSYDALDRLLRFAFFTWDNWELLTGQKRPGPPEP